MPEIELHPPESVEVSWWRRPKVVAVFAASDADAAVAVSYVRQELPHYPIWLFTTADPTRKTRNACERVIIRPRGGALLRTVWQQLVPAHWMALGVTAWTGHRSESWLLKVAPLLIPPFRTLVLNEHKGFFAPTPWMLIRHLRGRLWHIMSSTIPGTIQANWFKLRYKIWGRSIVVRDRTLFLWRWWPVLLRERWEPLRVKLVYDILLEGVIGRLLSIWQRLKDVYWAVADPFEKRAFAFHRLLNGLWRRCWALPMQGILSAFYPLMQQRFARYAATATGVASRRTILPLTQAPSTEDFTVVHYGAKRWSRRLLTRLAAESPSRFLLLLRDRAVLGDLSGLIPLFDDPDTFAVAPQTETRAWDRSLFCRAPFRQLQAGEASQVLAPVAPVVLIDRAKLHALGVPYAWFPQAALFLLFWRAAAVGWRAYCVGQPIQAAPAWRWPSEETEVAGRVMLRSRTAIPDTRLSWGNTAFQVSSPRQTTRERPLRVLIVSPYLPYPLSHGGAVRIYNLCRALAPRVEFLLASFREKTDVVQYDKLHEVFREVYVVDRDEPLNPDESLPMQVRGQQSRAMEALVEEICSTHDVDLVQIEYTHLAPLRRSSVGRPAVWVEHDITFSLYRQLAEKTPTEAAQAEFDRWRGFERRWFSEYEAIWTMSPADRELAIREGAPAARTLVVPNGVDINRFRPEPVSSETPEIFFVGSFRHYPNILAFEQLQSEVMPGVWEQFPQARLRVVAGPEPEHYWRELKKEPYPKALDPRILLHGFVEDLRPLYTSAAVVAMPLLVSAGTNIKLMEAMACGKAVVSTAIGCAGLDLEDGRELLIRDTGAGFVEAIRQLLADATYRDRIARQARRAAEDRFSWTSIAEEAYRSYTNLVAASS